MEEKTISNIQKPNRLYNFLRYYVDNSIFQAYRKIDYVGLEKVPNDAAIIYAPNHTNTLMDALVVLSMDEKPKVFVARADIFKNPKIAKILYFLKMLPIMRIRDGMEEVKKNNEIIEKSIDVLEDKVPFCILPEGRHRPQHSLLPLSKGIFRIAFQAYEKFGDKTPIYIIPCGIEYGNFYRFRSTVLVQIGDPINIGKYIKSHPDLSTAELMNMLKDDLTERIKEVILYIPDDEHYDDIYELCSIVINQQVKKFRETHYNSKKNSLMTRFLSNKKTVADSVAFIKNNPEKAEELLSKTAQVRELRKKSNISLATIVVEYPFWNRLLKYLVLLITLPYILSCSLLVSPISIIARVLFKKMKDRAFFNSVRFVLKLVIWPILFLIYTIIAFCNLPWEIAIITIAAIMPANIIAQDAFRLLRLIISDLRYSFNRPLRKKIKEVRDLYIETIKI